jgi:hypothetical protein
LDPVEGRLSLRSLGPVSSKDSLSIHQAAIRQSDITSSLIRDSPSISTSSLTVEDFTDLRGDVVVGGSMSVHGTVVGSGPYVDSSDATLKRNVSSLRNALDIVQHMNAVSGLWLWL